MTYEDLLDWFEDEYGYDFDDWEDYGELYENMEDTWNEFERGNFSDILSFDNFINQFEDS